MADVCEFGGFLYHGSDERWKTPYGWSRDRRTHFHMCPFISFDIPYRYLKKDIRHFCFYCKAAEYERTFRDIIMAYIILNKEIENSPRYDEELSVDMEQIIIESWKK